MSKLCMVTAQLVPWNGMVDEVVSGVRKKSKEQKRIRQVMPSIEEVEWCNEQNMRTKEVF